MRERVREPIQENTMRYRIPFIGALLLLALSLPAFAASSALRDFNGNARDIADFTGNGKWLVVMIWASDCQVCNAEAYKYVDFHTFHKDNDARMLGISMDGAAKKNAARAFIDRHNVNFPNLIGEPQDVAGLYTRLTGQPWRGTPTFLIYSPSGELRAQQVGAVPPHLIEQFIQKNSKG
jgi:peroxiredoxin